MAETLSYLAESANEGERLAIKTDRNQLFSHFTKVDLTAIPARSRIVDAGAGVGIVSEAMVDFLPPEKKPDHVLLLDMSKSRLSQASARISGRNDRDLFSFLACDLHRMPLENGSVDFLFCRFVFEYLSAPRETFSEFFRVLKPGGKLVIGDLDHISVAFFPIEADLLEDLHRIMHGVEKVGFDLYAGRKIYHLFNEAGMENIRVHVESHNLMYGALRENDRRNWEMKMEIFESVQKKNRIDFGVDMARFRRRFMTYLQEPSRFSYTPLIMVEGVKSR